MSVVPRFGGGLRDFLAHGNHRHAVESLGTELLDLLRQRLDDIGVERPAQRTVGRKSHDEGLVSCAVRQKQRRRDLPIRIRT